MRKLIAGMRVSVDGKVEGPSGVADWVEDWSDGYGLTQQVDACLLGGGMYPGYEEYWSVIQAEPDQPHRLSGNVPTPAEVDWARFASQTPHYVLSSTLESTRWRNASLLRRPEEVADLKRQSGKDIYLIGGARTVASLIDAGLVDELRLVQYPLIAGEGKALFATAVRRRGLELRRVEQLTGGRVSLSYRIA